MRVKNSISLKVVLILFLGNLTILIFLAVYFLYGVSKKIDLLVNDESNFVAERLAYNIIYPLWNINEKEMEKALDFELKSSNIIGIFLEDYDGKPLIIKYKQNNELVSMVSQKEMTKISITLRSNYHSEKRRIYFKDEYIGELEIFVTDKNIKKEFYHKFFGVVFEVFLFSVIIFLIFYFTLRKYILTPLLILEKYVQKVRDKNFSVKMPFLGNDEIGKVGSAFNEMTDKLNESFKLQQNLLEEVQQKNEILKIEEKMLRETTDELRALFKALPDLYLRLDYEGKIVDYKVSSTQTKSNRNISNLLDEGKNIFDVLGYEHKKEILDAIQEVINTNQLTYREFAIRTNQGFIHEEMRLLPLANEEKLIAIIRDITERKQIEASLEYAKDYLNKLFDSLDSWIISIDGKKKINYWNSSIERYTDFNRDYVIGKEIKTVFPFFEKYYLLIEQVMKKLEAKEIISEEIAIKNEKKFFNIFIFPLAFEKSEGVVLKIDDVTGATIKEQQLIQAQKMETVGNLAGGMAHDFNNILGGIIGTVSTLKYLIKKEIDIEKLEKSLNIIDNASNRAASLVNKLLTLSRKQDLDFRPVNLNELLDHIYEICHNTFDKSIELNFKKFPDIALSLIDMTQIEQVILNLCINAMHAMTIMRSETEKQGGILSLSIDKIKSDRYLKTRYASIQEDEYWIIKIRDTGVGIEEKTLKKIFEPFFTTKNKEQGTGLGLSMVYNIVKQHSGVIDVYSEVGIGTTFNIFLPVYHGERKELTQNNFDIDDLHGNGKILVIDDEDVIREIALNMLEELGYEVLVARDGIEGIEIFTKEKENIDLIILDMAMPRMSGKEVFVKLRDISQNIKILMASGFRQDERIKDSLDLGVDAFIQKPYSIVALGIKVKEILSQNNEGAK